MQSSEETSLYRYDAQSSKLSHMWGMSNQQFLFSTRVYDMCGACIAVRLGSNHTGARRHIAHLHPGRRQRSAV